MPSGHDLNVHVPGNREQLRQRRGSPYFRLRAAEIVGAAEDLVFTYKRAAVSRVRGELFLGKVRKVF
ncbi:hypothetical protein EVAR_29815_1 [Eumeta japonica]|uniref:Uncharacterized protein n=1 Tax=Eumeta variegata TaxID=151549 RepID=A0A4C1XMW5_EUMVA|nr:hypothetical protein EVAR_29815_1 [Eumeta japonica]